MKFVFKSPYIVSLHRGVEQLVARRAHNPKVAGSNPVPATIQGYNFLVVPFFYALTFLGMEMFTVYVLHSERFDKIYIGFSQDLEVRLKSHNELGKKGWTIRFRPWKLIHVEEFASKTEAMRREKELKSSAGRRWTRETIIQQM